MNNKDRLKESLNAIKEFFKEHGVDFVFAVAILLVLVLTARGMVIAFHEEKLGFAMVYSMVFVATALGYFIARLSTRVMEVEFKLRMLKREAQWNTEKELSMHVLKDH